MLSESQTTAEVLGVHTADNLFKIITYFLLRSKSGQNQAPNTRVMTRVLPSSNKKPSKSIDLKGFIPVGPQGLEFSLYHNLF